MSNKIVLIFYRRFHETYIRGLFTRNYGISLAAIEFLENLTEEKLPKKRKYVADIKEIVERAILTDYSKRTGVPIEKLDKEDVERNSPFYAQERDVIESWEQVAGVQLQMMRLEDMLKNPHNDKK